MKKTLLLSLLVSIASVANADYTGPGFYRIKNYKTQRYASVVDNYGRIDFANSTADLQAIELHKNFETVSGDPASILYIFKTGEGYQIEAQGTGIYQIIQHYLLLKEAGSANANTLYNAYGEMSGVIKYIGDVQVFSDVEQGAMSTNAKGDYIKWYILPVETESDNFMGVIPNVSLDDKHYTTFYTSFPYSLQSNGMKAYYVKDAANGKVVLEEIEGTIPANTPVIIECVTEHATTNRLNLKADFTIPAIADNRLKGAFFCCNKGGNHVNRVVYDKNTMRVLGICSDGSLGFIVPEELDYIPANQCYITVAAGSPEEFKIVSREEYDAGVDSVAGDRSELKDVYNLQGHLIRSNASQEEINSLPHGIYIIGGKKVAVK